MERTPDEQLAAIIQIRDYAAAYEGKRKEFYTDLLAMLTTPIRDDADYLANVKRMYLAAIGALTAEIQPPTTTTYDAVLECLNSALDEGTLGPVRLTVVPDDTREDYAIPGGSAQRSLQA
ncbi:hypothetical protein [Xanthomonas campestris]|uniref:hypothetical protein n=1 Tax=Xanthomonas campestris TaxID=339 RepID=UPI00388EBEB6